MGHGVSGGPKQEPQEKGEEKDEPKCPIDLTEEVEKLKKLLEQKEQIIADLKKELQQVKVSDYASSILGSEGR